MDLLFNKVFNNRYISNLIFGHVQEINNKLCYQSYNYYQLPLLTVIKLKNEQLLLEKLKLYNNLFIDNNTDSNNNNKNNNKIYKYYININKECITELFNWKGLSISSFKLVFETFEKEIQTMKMTHGQDKLLLFSIPMVDKLISNGNIDALNYILNNHLPQPIQTLPTQPQQRIPNEILNIILNCLEYKKSNIIYTFEILNSIIFPNIKFTNDEICKVLVKVAQEKTTSIYGQLFIEKMKKQPYHKGYDHLGSQQREAAKNVSAHIGSTITEVLRNDDKLLLHLLIKKIISINDPDGNNAEWKCNREMVYDGGVIEFNYKIIKSLGLTRTVLFQSNMFELFQVLVMDGHKEFQEFELISDLVENSYFPNRFYDTYKPNFTVSNKRIANYLLENQFENVLKSKAIHFDLSIIDQDNPVIRQLITHKTLRWDTVIKSELTLNQLEFIINNGLLVNFQHHLMRYLATTNNYECIQLLVGSKLIPFSPFESYVQGFIENGDRLISKCILSKISEYNTTGTSQSRIIELYKHILVWSCKYGNFHSFKLVLRLFIDYFRNNVESTNQLVVFYGDLGNLDYETRYNFIFHLNEIDKSGTLFCNEFLKSNPKSSDDEFLNQSPSKEQCTIKILTCITHGNYKLLKSILFLPNTNQNLKFDFEHYKKKLLYHLLNANPPDIKTLFYMISIGFFKPSNLPRIIKYSYKFKIYTVLNLLLCKGSFKTTPFKMVYNDFNSSTNIFNQYIELVHYYIYKYSIGHDFIKSLNGSGYKYKSVNGKFENTFVKYDLIYWIPTDPIDLKYYQITDLISKIQNSKSDEIIDYPSNDTIEFK